MGKLLWMIFENLTESVRYWTSIRCFPNSSWLWFCDWDMLGSGVLFTWKKIFFHWLRISFSLIRLKTIFIWHFYLGILQQAQC